MKKRLLFLGLLAMAVAFGACMGRKPAFPMRKMQSPPAALHPNQVPMFVSFGSDDNPYSGMEGSGGSGALHYLTELFASRLNPGGSPLHYSFYVNTMYITGEGEEEPIFVKRSWQEAIDHGNEIGVHTHSHPHGWDYSVEQWQEEILRCINVLTGPDGLGVGRDQILGFRTPFLEYSDRTLTAVQRTHLQYDCSIEEGYQPDQDGVNFVWPYLLDHGSPGNTYTHLLFDLPLIGEHPGLWELPIYPFVAPPDDLAERYGVPAGFRARLQQKRGYFKIDQGKITGMDWNLWSEYGMNKAEFVATLKYTLDLRLKGNRCPLTVGLHSRIYADRNPNQFSNSTVEERREAVREFLDYALSKPQVRVVSARELLAWLRSPTPLSP